MEDFVNLVKEILNDVKDETTKKMLELKIECYDTVFCSVRWRNADIAGAIESKTGVVPTEENVAEVRAMIKVPALENRMVEEGWFYIEDAVDRWDEEKDGKENGGM